MHYFNRLNYFIECRGRGNLPRGLHGLKIASLRSQ